MDTTTLAEIGATLNLSPRQVSYRLKGVKIWLEQRDIALEAKPGVGYELDCSAEERDSLLKELNARSTFDLVLNAGERQQLLALKMLISEEPFILKQLEYLMDSSRATILKDMDVVEGWLADFPLLLDRRPNYGFSIEGGEIARRQAIVALLWGDTPFSDLQLLKISYNEGLVFSLSDEAEFSPLLQQVNEQVQKWDVNPAFEWVAQAEAQMGGRFADNAVLHIALALAVQQERVQAGKICRCSEEDLEWLKSQPVWTIATNLANSFWADVAIAIPEVEVAVIAMHLIVGLRNEEWHGDLYTTSEFKPLIDMLMENIAQAFFEPDLAQDLALREGLTAHLVPALMRQRFNIWTPPSWSDKEIVENCQREHKIAESLANLVEEHMG
ncbi:MAG: BglG family transcription antiterminator, partial [Anaerolineae bacterium]